VIEVRELSLRYPGRAAPTLRRVNLRVRKGELVLVAGPTGCGKSSLLNCLNGILVHESAAVIEGEILLEGRDIRGMPLREICRLTGSVFQNPDSQLCTATVESEVAFGLENMAVERGEMRRRMDEALETVALLSRRHDSVATLSGGQKQRLAIACALALRPRILLLDEPVSQLDTQGAAEILEVIARLSEHHDLAVLLIEHRLEETARLADRVVLMDQGGVVSDKLRDEALRDLTDLRSLGLAVPQLPDLFCRLGRTERPLTAEEAPLLPLASDRAASVDSRRTSWPQPPFADRPLEVEGCRLEKCPLSVSPTDYGLQTTVSKETCVIRNLGFRYGKNAPLVLDDLSTTFHRGDRVALMGANGSGKSTLLHLLAGTLKPTSGTLEWFDSRGAGGESRSGGADGVSGTAARREKKKKSNGVPRAGLVLQVPDLMLFQETVADEIRFAPRHLGVSAPECDEITRDILERMGLTELADEAPFSLSRGQRLRAAVGSVLSMRPRVLLLDEPTTGQDREQIERMMDGLAEGFDLVVFCTHDVDTAARHASRVIVLAEGGVLLDGPPGEVLFDAEGLGRAKIRQTSILRYAARLGVHALGVGELVEILK